MTATEQRRAALLVANEKRMSRDQLRRDLITGAADWRQMILEPPACIHGMLISEALLLIPGVRRTKVEQAGRQAFHAGITLTIRCERASMRTREWVAGNLLPAASGRLARPRQRARTGMSKSVLLP